MRDNSKDRTVERNYIQKWRFLVREYELVQTARDNSISATHIQETGGAPGVCPSRAPFVREDAPSLPRSFSEGRPTSAWPNSVLP